MKMFHIHGYKIKEVEVAYYDFKSDKVVMLNGNKHAMTSTLNAYRGTREEAELVLMANMENRIRDLEHRLAQARDMLTNFLHGEEVECG
jgi:hypothetical protein